MSGRCPTSGLVCLRGERQGAGAWAAPGPLHPLPRLCPRYCAGAPGQGRHDAFGVRRPIGALYGWGRKVAVMAERPLVGWGMRRAYAERMPLFKAGRRWLLDRTG